ncbi:hypothetical protein OC188_01605 [Anaplasma capra]|uniref:hypothetical protein n=1 Tax=Anaplasma capra TaxID=1562740 RepID=UPI0021D5A737|nr:hypothetical protein [Anaplasma capra]MCU7611395.1 hypothetical protein [Anaplasma capra]
MSVPPSLSKSPSGVGKSLLATPECLYRGDSKGKEHALALGVLKHMYDCARRSSPDVHIEPIDFDNLENVNEEWLSSKFVELSELLGSQYSCIPMEVWRVFVRIAEVTPDCRQELTKFLSECFDPDTLGSDAVLEISPNSLFKVSAREDGKVRKKTVFDVTETINFSVVSRTTGKNLGQFTAETKCTISKSKQKPAIGNSVQMDIRGVDIKVTNDKLTDNQAGHSCKYNNSSKQTISLEPFSSEPLSVPCDVKKAPDRLLSSDKFIIEVFDSTVDSEEYTPNIFKMFVCPALGIEDADKITITHNTLLQRSSTTQTSTLHFRKSREQNLSVEKRAVLKKPAARGKEDNMHVVLTYNIVHTQPQKGSSSTRIKDIQLYTRTAPEAQNSAFLHGDSVIDTWRSSLNIGKDVQLNTDIVWRDAIEEKGRHGYESTPTTAQKPVQYSASQQDQWCTVSEDTLKNNIESYRTQHKRRKKNRQLVTSKGVLRDMLEYLVNRAVYSGAGGSTATPPLKVERHIIAHRGLVSGQGIAKEHNGSQHRIEEHFILGPADSKGNGNNLKVHAFVSYHVHGYNWSAELGKTAHLGQAAKLGMRFVNPQFDLNECLKVGNSSIASGSFRALYDIKCQDVEIVCSKFKEEIKKIDTAKDGALFSSQYRGGDADSGSVEEIEVDQEERLGRRLTEYFSKTPSIETEQEFSIIGHSIPETVERAKNAVSTLSALLNNNAVCVAVPPHQTQKRRVGSRAKAGGPVKFTPRRISALCAAARTRLALIELLETWVEQTGYQAHTALFETTINLCSNFPHDSFAESLIDGHLRDRTQSPDAVAVVDRKVFLHFEQCTGEDGRPQDKVRVVQHALLAPMTWWDTENVHLVVCYDVCMTQQDNGIRRLQVENPIAAARLCDDLVLHNAEEYASRQGLEQNDFTIVDIPGNLVPKTVDALAVMQSTQHNFDGYRYLIQGMGGTSRNSALSVSEKMQACVMEFIGLYGVGDLVKSEYISPRTADFSSLTEDCIPGRTDGNLTTPETRKAAYSELAGILSRVDHDGFIEFFCSALGVRRINDRGSGKNPETSVFAREIQRPGRGMAVTHVLSFSAESGVENALTLDFTATISYDLRHRGTSGTKSFFSMCNPSVAVKVCGPDGAVLGETKVRSEGFARLRAIVEVPNMGVGQQSSPEVGHSGQFVRKLQDITTQQDGKSEASGVSGHTASPSTSGAPVTILRSERMRHEEDGDLDDSDLESEHEEADEDIPAPSNELTETAQDSESEESVDEEHISAEQEECAGGAQMRDLSSDIAAYLSASTVDDSAGTTPVVGQEETVRDTDVLPSGSTQSTAETSSKAEAQQHDTEWARSEVTFAQSPKTEHSQAQGHDYDQAVHQDIVKEPIQVEDLSSQGRSQSSFFIRIWRWICACMARICACIRKLFSRQPSQIPSEGVERCDSSRSAPPYERGGPPIHERSTPTKGNGELRPGVNGTAITSNPKPFPASAASPAKGEDPTKLTYAGGSKKHPATTVEDATTNSLISGPDRDMGA